MNQIDKTAIDFNKTRRYKIGIGLIVFGHVCLLSGMLIPLLGMTFPGKTRLVGMMILGGELITISSIVFLGKAGFMTIKKKIFGFFKEVYVARVGYLRHYFGISLLFTNVLTTYVTAFYAWTAFRTATPENPMPAVWGLSFAQQESLVLWLFLVGEITFLVAIYVLGADWWERFRNIIVWKKTNQQIDSTESESTGD